MDTTKTGSDDEGREGRKLLKGLEERGYRVESQGTGKRRAVTEMWTRRGGRG